MDWRLSDYPQQLAGKLFAIANELAEIEPARQAVNRSLPVNLALRLPSNLHVMNGVLTEWLSQLLRGYSAAAQGASSAMIDIKDLSSKHTNFKDMIFACTNFPGCSFDDVSLAEASKMVSVHYDFAGLIAELDELSETLEDSGLISAADILADGLSMIDYGGGSLRSHPIVTAKAIKLTLSFYRDTCSSSYSYRIKEKLCDIISSLITAETAAGIDGLSDSFSQIYDDLEKGNWSIREPRTVINGGKVMCTIFTEKFQFSLSHQMCEGLVSFIKTYSTKPLWLNARAA